MANQSIVDTFGELNAATKKYIQAHIDLFKVRMLEKLIRIGTYFFSAFTLIIAMAFILISLTFAFTFWYGSNYGTLSEGFLISAGFYLVLAIFLYAFRKQLFTNNIIKNMANILFSDDEDDKL
ncbi:MAG: phage holin family protein [Bacteroidetes bacterium]|nr:phage holin family protein [Bacteroidota bacterium]